LSIKVTFKPRSEAKNAAAYPPGPAPIITSCFLSKTKYLIKNISIIAKSYYKSKHKIEIVKK